MASTRSNKRRRRNRGRFGGLYKLLSALIILAVLAVGCIIFFRVNVITVEGQSRYTAQEVVEASGLQLGDNLLLLNRGGTAQAILKKLPYVDEVAIRRQLPDQVTIAVSECAPAGAIQGEGAWWLLDARGKVLERIAGTPAGVAKIVGVTALAPSEGTYLALEEGTSLQKEGLVGLLTALEEAGKLSLVTQVDMSAVGEIAFTYDGRFTVLAPLGADYGQKIQILEAMVEKLQPNETGRIDLTREERVYFNPNVEGIS